MQLCGRDRHECKQMSWSDNMLDTLLEFGSISDFLHVCAAGCEQYYTLHFAHPVLYGSINSKYKKLTQSSY